MIELPLLLYTYRRRLECTGFSLGQHGNTQTTWEQEISCPMEKSLRLKR